MIPDSKLRIRTLIAIPDFKKNMLDKTYFLTILYDKIMYHNFESSHYTVGFNVFAVTQLGLRIEPLQRRADASLVATQLRDIKPSKKFFSMTC